MVSQAGAVLLVETVRKTGLDTAISVALAPWLKPRAVHDPGKILPDVALAVALGGDCLADVGMLRAEPAVFGPVASDPTVSRLVGTLAAGGQRALNTIRSPAPSALTRMEVGPADGPGCDRFCDRGPGRRPGDRALRQGRHSCDLEKTFGHHPLTGFVDHGTGGSGKPVAALLRTGNAGSNTAADHATTTQLALVQLPKSHRRGRRTLIRTDSAGGAHEFVAWLAQRGRWLSYSVGMTITDAVHQAVVKVPLAA
ncbi:transposase [Streptomyces tendae]|uniref:transposase n=1 Tax=Streptomyces tendae TaxID=1932 RepID=UPI003797F62A